MSPRYTALRRLLATRPTLFATRALSLSALLGVFAGGCVANDISLTIDKFIPPMKGTCTLTPGTDSIQTRGVYDVRIGRSYDVGYAVGFIVTNNLPKRDSIPVETQAYYVQGFDVELEVDGPAAALLPASARLFHAPASSLRLAPGGTAGASVIAIKPGQLAAIADNLANADSNILVRIRPVATRAEEQVVGAFSTFPILVCAHCLSGPVVVPACPFTAVVPETALGNTCNPAADQGVACCQSGAAAGARLLCGADAPVVTPP